MKNELQYIKEISLLYVEDDEHTREELEYFLETKVAKLYVAKDGKEGLEHYKKHKPDLVLTDVQMPNLDGISMSKEIKALNPDAKIILLTAFNDSEYLFEAIQTGIDSYKIKPVNIKDLLSSIAKKAKEINLEKENQEIYNTLTQYRDIVDERSIVSKTDKNGIITYINKPFEEISGYTKEELIGQSHSLIKHKDTNPKIFKEMWATLINKKTWFGTIKNKKKNGDYYIVDTIIKPILDVDGQIVEFIALRTDITELEMSKEYFKNKTIKATSNLKESIRKANAYKDAIEESNIILIINKNKEITYVNDAFCKISGYSKEELLGSPYSMIKDKTISDEEYDKQVNNIMNHIENQKIFKGKVTNTAKDGSLFHCTITLYPLGGEFEYISIRHDITELENLREELEDTQKEILYKLGEICETRSKETGNHVNRVAEYSKILATKIGLSKEEISILYKASPIHDIGKVGIPDSILNKPGKLTADEWDIMRTHSEIGYDILKDSKRPLLKAASIISYTHHEKWNGKGYPRGLEGEEIHIFGRITAIADVFDALGSDRCYKEAWPLDKILELFENQRGKHFEPRLVDIFLGNLDEFLEVRDKYKD